MRALLVSPSTPSTFWSFSYVLRIVGKKAAFPPLGLLTVAAMLPDTWDLRVIDLNVRPLAERDLAWADVLMISAMLVHEPSARDVIARAKAAGKPVIAGGPLFTTSADRFAEVDCCVIGEAEDIMAELVDDLEQGRLRRRYQAADRPDISTTPLPRWDLINVNSYLTMSVQCSRGCPFDCEFCDITAVYGRMPRVKSPGQMISELEAVLATGYRGAIFIVDDNFIGNRAKTKALLRALIGWQRARGLHLRFTTEASINLVDDDELLDLMAQAGFRNVFIGIESPQEASLRECRKAQNLRRDLVAAVRKIHSAGMQVMGGFIVGFDADGAGVFEHQRRFIQEAGVVTAMVGMLTALPGTRLFTRLTREGRILSRSTGDNLDAMVNFVPALDRRTLIEGYRRLVKEIYAPRAYYHRVQTFLREYRPARPAASLSLADIRAFIASLWIIGVLHTGRREYWKFIMRALISQRRTFALAVELAIMGHHFRRIARSL